MAREAQKSRRLHTVALHRGFCQSDAVAGQETEQVLEPEGHCRIGYVCGGKLRYKRQPLKSYAV